MKSVFSRLRNTDNDMSNSRVQLADCVQHDRTTNSEAAITVVRRRGYSVT